jgi:hypothetical protein
MKTYSRIRVHEQRKEEGRNKIERKIRRQLKIGDSENSQLSKYGTVGLTLIH